jgi:hypothetical protein
MTLTAPLFRSGHQLKDGLNQAPNPKPTTTDKARFGKLASLYTAFSCDFAAHALDICLRAGCTNIADPFGGMGTLAEAGRTRPVNLQLGDISPFAVLSGAFRSALREEIEAGAALLEDLSALIAAGDEGAFFARLFSEIEAYVQDSVGAVIAAPSEPEHRIAALAIYLAALSRIRLYRGLSGSNPTWIKRPGIPADISSTLESIKITINTSREFASQLPNLHPENHTSSTWSSIETQKIAPGSLDAILTSPPYANRTDYIRHYLPASELLLAASGRDERLVRAQQIGTPLIRATEPDQLLPASVQEVLHRIRTHPSYASERYYYKGFLYYFTDMFDALLKMRDWLRRDGLLLMVVQDTYYKEIRVPTADMLVDIAMAVGFQSTGRRDWRVHQHLSRLSPHSRRTLPNRVLSESIVVLSR